MKRVLTAVLAACTAGCVTSPAPGEPGPRPPTPEEQQAQDAAKSYFEAWRQAVIARDPVGVLRRMSSQMVADWLYRRMADPTDSQWAAFRGRLPAGAGVELDYWYGRNKHLKSDFSNGKPDRLPQEVLQSTWLVETWDHYYRVEAADQAMWAKAMQVSEVYVDGPAVTLLVRISGAPAWMAEMVVEGAEWKLNHVMKRATRGSAN